MKRQLAISFLSLVLAVAYVACGEDEEPGGGGGNNNGDAGADLRPVNFDTGGVDMGTDTGSDGPVFSGEVCDNTLDDDSDTLVDCDDPDCSAASNCDGGGGGFEVVCDDTLDDDDDGRIDCNDPDCATDPACNVEPGDEICDNTTDDDSDGLIDCFDGDCATDPACRADVAEVCDNGVDDDGDTAVDCDDADCVSFCEGGGGGDLDILCAFFCLIDPQPDVCLADCLGGGGVGGEDCTNGVDDNGDGAVDCEDLACLVDPACGF